MHSIRCEKWQKIEKNESDITLVEKKERKYITIKWSTKIMLMLWNTKIKYANCWSFCCYWKCITSVFNSTTKYRNISFRFLFLENWNLFQGKTEKVVKWFNLGNNFRPVVDWQDWISKVNSFKDIKYFHIKSSCNC